MPAVGAVQARPRPRPARGSRPPSASASGGDSGDCLYAIARAFLEWFDTSPSSIGRTTFLGLTEFRAGRDPAACGLASESLCGNGSLMRALPTALIRADPGRRRRESEMISAVTHAQRRCADSCVAYNEIAARPDQQGLQFILDVVRVTLSQRALESSESEQLRQRAVVGDVLGDAYSALAD